MQTEKKNKWTTAYEPTFYEIVCIAGSQIQARRLCDGRLLRRDATWWKAAGAINVEEKDDKRDKLLANVPPASNTVEPNMPLDEVTPSEQAAQAPVNNYEQRNNPVPTNPVPIQDQTQTASRPQRARQLPARLRSDYILY